jgi:biotin carboxyl carrier protein
MKNTVEEHKEEEPKEEESKEEESKEEEGKKMNSPSTGDEDLSTIEGELVVLRQALQDYDRIQSEIYLLKTDAEVEATKEVYDEAAEKVNSLSKTLETLLTTGSAEGAVYKARLDAYNQAEIAYLNALDSLDAKRANDYQAQAAKGIDLNATMQELEVAKAKLAELTGTDGENITAKVAGTVTSVECNAGDKKMKDDVLCTIEVPDQGYTLSFTATNEQASRLRIGDQATVSNFYWGNEVTATLSSIKTDPKNPQNNKLLTFDLEGNVTSGSQLTISVGSKSANYDLIIPSSAIRSDSNGSFVLKVEAKNSPLGNRYIAKRVPVEVLASDDNNSAVTAELQYGDYVITTSSAPIKNGSMVRLANAS